MHHGLNLAISPQAFAAFINARFCAITSIDYPTLFVDKSAAVSPLPSTPTHNEDFYKDIVRSGEVIAHTGERLKFIPNTEGLDLGHLVVDAIAYAFPDHGYLAVIEGMNRFYQQALMTSILGFFKGDSLLMPVTLDTKTNMVLKWVEDHFELTMQMQHNTLRGVDRKNVWASHCDLGIEATLRFQGDTCVLSAVSLSGQDAGAFNALLTSEISHKQLNDALAQRQAFINALPKHVDGRSLTEIEQSTLLAAIPLNLFLDYAQTSNFTLFLNTLRKVYGQETVNTSRFIGNLMRCISEHASNDEIHVQALEYFTNFYEILKTSPLVHLAEDTEAPTPDAPDLKKGRSGFGDRATSLALFFKALPKTDTSEKHTDFNAATMSPESIAPTPVGTATNIIWHEEVEALLHTDLLVQFAELVRELQACSQNTSNHVVKRELTQQTLATVFDTGPFDDACIAKWRTFIERYHLLPAETKRLANEGGDLDTLFTKVDNFLIRTKTVREAYAEAALPRVKGYSHVSLTTPPSARQALAFCGKTAGSVATTEVVVVC